MTSREIVAGMVAWDVACMPQGSYLGLWSQWHRI